MDRLLNCIVITNSDVSQEIDSLSIRMPMLCCYNDCRTVQAQVVFDDRQDRANVARAILDLMLECQSPHDTCANSASLSASSSRSTSDSRPSCKVVCRLPPALTAPRHRGIGYRRGGCSAACRRVVASAERYSIPPPPGVQDAERIPWQDSSTDVAFIGMCRKAYGKLAGWQSNADWKDGVESYRGMIEVSRALMRVRKSARNAHRHLMPSHTAACCA